MNCIMHKRISKTISEGQKDGNYEKDMKVKLEDLTYI